MSRVAADIIAKEIKENPEIILGLATGGTPVSTYKRLVEMNKQGLIDFRSITTFNLDEYVGLDVKDDNSYRYFMDDNLFNRVNMDKNYTHLPNGNAADLEKEGKRYEKLIDDAGGIDLQLLGIGGNAHIGFNEPDKVFSASTHVVKLKESTINANKRFFEENEKVPDHAISMGIKTIMKAKKVLLLASGSSKADALYNSFKGDIDPMVPASVLQLHHHVIVVADRAAAEKLLNTDLAESFEYIR